MNLFRMLIIFLVFILLNVYLFLRGWQALPSQGAVHFVYALLFIVASTAVFIAVFAGSKLPLWLGHTLELIGGYWIILFIFLLFGAFLGDLLRIANHYTGFFPQWISANYTQAKLWYFIAVMAILMLISIAGYYRFSNPRIKKVEIGFDDNRLKSDFRIIAVSDMHLGNLIRKERLSGWVSIINAQKPDVILIAGDIFDHNIHAVADQDMNRELSLLSATYGVYAIPGNHDYYAGIDSAMSYIQDSGIKVLRDQAVIVDQKIMLIGRDDLTNKSRKTLKSLINGIKTDLPLVVLDHQPQSFAESLENEVDLHFSGHTHNGQIFPFNRIVSKIYELGYGYKKSGNTHYYVSSGLGLWGAPLRLGTHSEIVSIVLKVN